MGDNRNIRNEMELLYIRYAPKIRQLAMYLLQDPSEAEDITQDVFMKLWENRSKLDSIESLDSYLFRMTRNSVLNVVKHRQTVKKYEKSCVQPSSPNPENDHVNKNIVDSLSETFKSLPENQKRIFMMNRLDDKTYEEIAEEMKISPRTVQYHISRVLKKFKDNIN